MEAMTFDAVKQEHVTQWKERVGTLRELLSDAVARRLDLKAEGVSDAAPICIDVDRKIRVLSELIEEEK